MKSTIPTKPFWESAYQIPTGSAFGKPSTEIVAFADTLPPNESSHKEINTTPHAGAAHASLHHKPELILVVDDDANVRESLGDVLTQEHYTVKLACDGRDAVRQFLDGPPDLILLDVNMPDIMGWQAFQILAQFHPFVPVMMITARPGQAPHAAKLGITAFMEKPLDIPVLLQTVRELLTHSDSAHFVEILHSWHTNDLWGSQG
jgi:CheY-like chemotaxis protein